MDIVSHSMDASILPDLSDINDTDDEVGAVLLSLSNQWSDEREGNWGEAAHCCHAVSGLNIQPCCGAWPQFWLAST